MPKDNGFISYLKQLGGVLYDTSDRIGTDLAQVVKPDLFKFESPIPVQDVVNGKGWITDKTAPKQTPDILPQIADKFGDFYSTLTKNNNLSNPQPVKNVLGAAKINVKARAAEPTVTPNVFSGFMTTPVPQQYSDLIANSAKENNIHPAVLASLLFSESGFRPNAVNYNRDINGQIIPNNYDRGIAQINSVAHPDVTDDQANDPSFAIPYAAKLLSSYIQQTGSAKLGIAAYNLGVAGALDPEKLATQGKKYLYKILKGVSPEVRRSLGLKLVDFID